MFYGKIHYKWPFSIAMLNYQRVNPIEIASPSGPWEVDTPVWRDYERSASRMSRLSTKSRTLTLPTGTMGTMGTTSLAPEVPSQGVVGWDGSILIIVVNSDGQYVNSG